MLQRRPSTNSQHNMDTNMASPTKSYCASLDSDFSPTKSRYGRFHKPKMQDDYVSTDKKVSAYLKLSPGNQMQYYNMAVMKEPKKKLSPKKTSPEVGTVVKRGRPPKPKTPVKDQQESMTNLVNSIKLEPQDPSLPVNGCEWLVGDLAWARVGGHPFWPCVIALDPIQKIFTKIVQRGRNSSGAGGQRWMHVQFFGDNGRRSWLNSSAIMAFHGREAFMQLAETVLAGMRKKDPKQTSAFVIKPAVVQVWEKAVQEAQDMASVTREERISFFATHFPLVPPKQFTRQELIDKVLDDSTVPSPKKRGRKRKADTSLQDEGVKSKQIKLEKPEDIQEKTVVKQPEPIAKQEEVRAKEEPKEESHSLLSSTPRTIADRKKRQALLIQMARSNQMAAADAAAGDVTPASLPTTPVDKPTPIKRPSFAESTPVEKKKPKRKYTKKTEELDFQNFHSRNFDRTAAEHPDLTEKDINKHIQNLWNQMDAGAKLRYRSKASGAALLKQKQEESALLEETMVEAVEENESLKSCSKVDEAELESSKSTSPTPSVGAVQKAPAAKRSCKTLFSGAKSEKVCQICEKVGETVRCRGPCQGFYHPNCITNPPPLTPSLPKSSSKKKGRPKKSIGELVEENRAVPIEEKDIPVTVESETTEEVLEKENTEVAVEVIEGEGKSLPKVRKSSKDSLSGEEEEGFRCKDCSEGKTQPCFACHEYVQKKTGEAKLYRCITACCGKVYHEECLRKWPQTSWRGNNRGVLTCPQHTCHTCVSDHPGVIKARYSNDKLVRCVRCPTSYHYGNYCLPAGSEILTNSQIICPQHYKPSKKSIIPHVNAAWCFICASGGSLICCDLCPTAFHADCLKISTPPDTYVCEDCQTGRFPLYGEIVWVKLGSYRWWPAEILYPSQTPDNILNLPHVRGEFAVRFFGSHDHYWVNRGRVFLYQDGDTTGKTSYKKSSTDQLFERAVKEASEAQRKYLVEKASRDAETRPGMKPPNYVKLKTNKPVGNVRTMDMNLSNLTPCECDPNADSPCAPDSDCLNRILMVECHPQVCPAGKKCCNQLFEKRQYPPLQPYQTQERGWGLKTLVPLKKGDFVIEYVGEMIDEEEYKRRLADMHERNEDNFYFLTIDKDRMLDAGPKGNVARFMNHSCQPNCETQKWTVNGDTRVGLFALCDIPADTELVFNYNLETSGNDKKPCMCGAPNCSGFIGVKAVKQEKEKEDNKEKKPVKKKKSLKAREGKCFKCSKEGNLVRCDGKHCPKGYHLSCLGKKQAPQAYWLCPWHQCNVCNKGRVQRCSLCVNSYCQEHAEGNIREDPVSKHLICTDHDQDKDVNKDKAVVEDSKDSSVLMEVDGNSSDNSTTTSNLSVDPLVKEATNNNVLKAADTPRLRTRRSKSFANDTIVNEDAERVNPRRNRPSSVDEALIVFKEKIEPKNKRSLKQKKKESASDSIAREILDEVINNLPDKISDFDNIENCEEKKEKINKVIDNLSDERINTLENVENREEKKEDLSPKESLKGTINGTDGDMLEQSQDDIPQNNETGQLNGCCDESEETEHKVGEVDKIEGNGSTAPNNESGKSGAVNVAEGNHSSMVQDSEPNALTDLDNEPETNKVEPKNERDPINDCSESESNVNSLDRDSLQLTNGFESEAHHSSIPGIIRKETRFHNGLAKSEEDECLEESCNDESNNGKRKEESLKSTSEIGSNEKCLEETCKDESVNEKRGEESLKQLNTNNFDNKFPEDTSIDESVNDRIQEESSKSANTINTDDNVDDFELSYSENSTDKLFKSVNNSESSIEMKVTDCGTTEEDEISRKLGEIHGTNELVNGIEQSSVMKVA